MRFNLIQSIVRPICALALVPALLTVSGAAHAERINVVELFTSQSCYSCPAADELMAKLAKSKENFLSLEFHVDYWNKLVYGSAGSWVDPFSSAEYTERQRRYAGAGLMGNQGVYTPQAVINGIYGAVGSNKRAIKRGLNEDSERTVDVDITQGEADTLLVNLSAEEQVDAQIYLVEYLKRVDTKIPNGENHGKVMQNHNIVVEMKLLGDVSSSVNEPIKTSFVAQQNRDCAVIVQNRGVGPIIGAARCP